MTTEIVIEDQGATPDGGSTTSADFAAGVAAATAVQAAGDAAEAEQTAEVAQAQAEVATEVAVTAEATAWDARVAVDELGAMVADGLAALRAELDARVPPAPLVVDTGVPAPDPKDQAPAPPADADEPPAKPKRTAYGSGRWFPGGN